MRNNMDADRKTAADGAFPAHNADIRTRPEKRRAMMAQERRSRAGTNDDKGHFEIRNAAKPVSPLIRPGKIHLGIEKLRCPRCRFPNRVEITSDLPAEDWLTCVGCGYKALLDIRPILKKYGLPVGLSTEEKRDFSHHLQRDLKKM